MFDNDNVMTDEVKLIIRWKIKGHLNESIEFNKSLIMSTHHYWVPPPGMAKHCYKFPNTVISVQIFHWKQVKIIVWVNSNITVQCWHFKMWYFLLFFLYYKFIKCQECNKNRQNGFSTTNYFAIVQRINLIIFYKWLLIFKVWKMCCLK
jgi:hypothetical protein